MIEKESISKKVQTAESNHVNINIQKNSNEKTNNNASPTRVLAAMSGGVDSSVVCTKLCEGGYEVEGATMLLREGLKAGATDTEHIQSQSNDIKDAKSICKK